MASENKLLPFRIALACVLLLLAVGLAAQDAADPQLPPVPDPSLNQATPVATVASGRQKINLILVGYDIDNNAAAKKMLQDMAQAALASGAKGQVLLAGKDNAVDLQQAMSQAVNIATGQVAGGGAGGGVLGIPASGVPSWAIILLGLLGAFMAVLAILVVSRRGGAAPGSDTPRIQASLEVEYPDGRQEIFHITQARIAIGRDADNQLVLDDGAVSLHHAEVLAGGQGFRIRDFGSANGTLVNGRRIAECGLYLGDEIVLGAVRLKLGG